MKRKVAIVAVAFVAIAGLARTGTAQIVHRDHFVTFDSPVTLPNGVALPVGRYLFRFPFGLQSTGRHDLTQILSVDQSTVFATLFTIPVERREAGSFEVMLEKTSAKTAPVLKAWFCDQTRTGHRFVMHVAS